MASIFTDIFSFFIGIFNASKKAWLKLETDIQQAAIWASGIIAVINANLSATPAQFWADLQKVFPTLTQAQVTEWLNKAGVVVGIIQTDANLSFEDAVVAFQAYLTKQGTGNPWIVATQGLVNLVLVEINPDIPVIQKVTSIGEYIYIDIVKPLLEKAA